MRNIGDMVWIAGMVHEEYSVVCPHCMGQKYIKAILPSGEEMDLHCCGCGGHAYDTWPTGRVQRHRYVPKAEQKTITGIDANAERVEYKFNNRYWCDVFDSEKEALEHAEVLRKKLEDEDHRKFVSQKENTKRTWAWNRYYHQNEIRKAKRDLAYHEAKLSFAKGEAQREKK